MWIRRSWPTVALLLGAVLALCRVSPAEAQDPVTVVFEHHPEPLKAAQRLGYTKGPGLRLRDRGWAEPYITRRYKAMLETHVTDRRSFGLGQRPEDEVHRYILFQSKHLDVVFVPEREIVVALRRSDGELLQATRDCAAINDSPMTRGTCKARLLAGSSKHPPLLLIHTVTSWKMTTRGELRVIDLRGPVWVEHTNFPRMVEAHSTVCPELEYTSDAVELSFPKAHTWNDPVLRSRLTPRLCMLGENRDAHRAVRTQIDITCVYTPWRAFQCKTERTRVATLKADDILLSKATPEDLQRSDHGNPDYENANYVLQALERLEEGGYSVPDVLRAQLEELVDEVQAQYEAE